MTLRLRRICGFENRQDVPSEATLSRAFAEFARIGLGQRVHAELIAKHTAGKVVLNVCRDATEYVAREKPAKKPPKEPQAPKKRGRKGKDDSAARPDAPGEAARSDAEEEALAELPTACDIGVKQDTHGKLHFWIGYKLHLDWSDSGFPLACHITSASMHDSQIAIPIVQAAGADLRSVL